MLTSMLKRVDVAAYKAFKDAAEGNWTSGIHNLGLADDGVGWALDEYNKDLLTEEMKAKVGDAAAAIVAGQLTVHAYTADNRCRYEAACPASRGVPGAGRPAGFSGAATDRTPGSKGKRGSVRVES